MLDAPSGRILIGINGNVICGHNRLLAALKSGVMEIPAEIVMPDGRRYAITIVRPQKESEK